MALKLPLFLCLLLIGLQGFGQTYEVQFNRPLAKGAKFRLENAVRVEDEVVHFDGPKSETNLNSRTLGFTGSLQVVDVDAKGLLKEWTSLVQSFRDTAGGVSRVVIPSGQTLLATHSTDKPDSYRFPEGPVLQPVEDICSLAFGRMPLEAPLGTTTPQKIGGEWSLDPKVFANGLPQGMVMERDAKTVGQLTGRTNLFGQECLQIHVTSIGSCAPQFSLDAELRKRGMDFGGGTFKIDYQGLLPTNTTLPPLSHHLFTSIIITNNFTGSNGKAGLIHRTEIDSMATMAPAPNQTSNPPK